MRGRTTTPPARRLSSSSRAPTREWGRPRAESARATPCSSRRLTPVPTGCSVPGGSRGAHRRQITPWRSSSSTRSLPASRRGSRSQARGHARRRRARRHCRRTVGRGDRAPAGDRGHARAAHRSRLPLQPHGAGPVPRGAHPGDHNHHGGQPRWTWTRVRAASTRSSSAASVVPRKACWRHSMRAWSPRAGRAPTSTSAAASSRAGRSRCSTSPCSFPSCSASPTSWHGCGAGTCRWYPPSAATSGVSASGSSPGSCSRSSGWPVRGRAETRRRSTLPRRPPATGRGWRSRSSCWSSSPVGSSPGPGSCPRGRSRQKTKWPASPWRCARWRS